MSPEYQSRDREILAPRIERRLDDGSWLDVRDFTKELHDRESSFVPEISNYVDLSIFSSREFAHSYRLAPVNSKVKVTDSDFHLDWFIKDMNKVSEFNNTAIAEIDDITINQVDNKILFGMKLDSQILTKERKSAINSNKRLTHVNLRWELSDLIFGYVRVEDTNSSRIARHARDIGEFMLKDNNFNVQFEPGIVTSHTMSLHGY